MTPAAVALIPVGGLPDIGPGDDLVRLIGRALAAEGLSLLAGDIVVLAQKIVSKAEGAHVDLATVTPGAEARRLAAVTGKDPRLVQVVLDESRAVLRARENVMIVEHRAGPVMANAGVDASNIGGGDRVLKLPRDADASAAALAARLSALAGGPVAVVINDSWGRAWRRGTVGHCVGCAGLPALWDRRGEPDMFGRPLQVTEIGLADEIAAAASLVMGAAAERIPAVILRGYRLPPGQGQGRAADLLRPRDQDMFR